MKLVWTRLSSDPVAEAVAAAKAADVVVAVVGITSNLEGEEMEVAVPGFLARPHQPRFAKEEEDLLVAASGKPLVVVLMNAVRLGELGE